MNVHKLTPREKLTVCRQCLLAIESHEGRQIVRPIDIDDDSDPRCDWCDGTENTTLYEIQ